MATSNFSGPIVDHQGDTALPAVPVVMQKTATFTLVNGAASGTFTLPAGAYVRDIQLDTPVTIPGTPTNTNLRIGSAANGQQLVADVDVKTQGVIAATLLYAVRNGVTTFFVTLASTGGTAASQVGNINVRVAYTYTG
jgi:hypothetical protein